MNRFIRLGQLVSLATVIASCASVDERRDVASANSVYPQPQSAGTEILVTFRDEQTDRPAVGGSVDPYRKRGNYGNSTWSERVADQLAVQYGLSPVAQWPIRSLRVHCVVYSVPADRPLDGVLHRLEKDEKVEAVQSMKEFRVMSASYSDPYFRLQRDLQSMHIDRAQQVATGRSVRIAVVDTGVDIRHADLRGQIAQSENFVPASRDSVHDVHGTAVSGVIAASANNGTGIVGVAPGSRLIAMKACWQKKAADPDAVCNSFTLALALDTAIHLKPEILNLSLAGPNDPLLRRLVEKAIEQGIIVVASDTADREPSFPASVDGVIAVRTAENAPPNSAVRARSITAPGNEILTTLPNDTYNFMSGSSFAAAHVSGVIALLLELDPRLSNRDVLAILRNPSANPTGPRETGVVDACAAVAAIRPSQACGTMPARRNASRVAASGYQ